MRSSRQKQYSPKQEQILSLGMALLKKAGLPCYITFGKSKAVARHIRLKRGGCVILVDSGASISAPQHIILHEAAHHDEDKRERPHGHKWARRLLRLYKVTNTPLPRSTKFESFRKLANLHVRIAPISE